MCSSDLVSDVSLARAIHGLRQRLAAGSKATELIRNIYGRGYILTAPVTVVDASESGSHAGRSGEHAAAANASMAPSRPGQERPIAAVATLARGSLTAVH